ncbi:MAG: hypothetical protein NW220_12340 [Leptolyngbyaceae cyanobacterium bins.349]|nr:hypothetical protein [Leptolyngbyaceae cyanobacterium bins.349]
MTIDKLQPAPSQQVNIYLPYYSQQGKRAILPYAISLYQRQSLEGERKIEGGESIPFLATWNASPLPSDLTRCRLQFDGNAELNYEVTIKNSDFIDFLIEVILNFKRARFTDFSQNFYRKLMRYED